MKRILPLLLLLLLAACAAPPIETQRLRPSKAAVAQLPVNTALFQKVALGQVTVPLDAEEATVAGSISQSAFHDALENALLDSTMLATVGVPGMYRLDARMIAFEKPGWGFTFEVPSEVDYTLIRQGNGAVVWRQTIRATGEGGFGDAFFDGVERRRIAMSASVRENVTQLVKTLSATPLGAPILPRPAEAKPAPAP